MEIVRLVFAVVSVLLQVYMAVLFVRVIFEWIPLFQRSWRPRGIVLVVAEVVYTVTDPPIRFVRRFVKPLRIGGMGIDLAFPIVFFAVVILRSLAASLAG